MKKRFIGVKLGTFLTVLACFIAAVILWLCVHYSDAVSTVQFLPVREWFGAVV